MVTTEDDMPELGNMIFGHLPKEPVVRVSREHQSAFHLLALEDWGLDGYGCPADEASHCPLEYHEEDNSWRAPNFLVRPYWWGDDDSPIADLPNFEIPAEDYKLWWYKYPLRDSYANKDGLMTFVKRHCIRPEVTSGHD